MEEILNKNIFHDKILRKFSPDYCPSNIYLRLQMRRTMARDTHSHGPAAGGVLKSDDWKRKNMTRGKDSTRKINKEIIRIRSNFDNINLRNNLMLNNTIKCIDSMKTKDLTLIDDDNDADVEEFIDLTNIDDVSDDMNNLFVCNDNDFKINNKPTVAKISTEIKTRTKTNRFTAGCNNNTGNVDMNNLSKDLLKVECKFNKPAPLKHDEMDMRHNDNMTTTKTHDKDIDIGVEQSTSRNNWDKQTNDLQTLLIMMAISPKSDENEDEYSDNNISDWNTNNALEVKPSNFTTIGPNTIQSEDFTELLNITPLRIDISDRQMNILTKYVNKWKDFVAKRKEYLLQQRQLTLNSFFDKLAKKKHSIKQSPENVNKAKQVVQDYSTYQHRYKVQKHIIALQKAKLDEQNRLIEELKYNKIVEASRQSVDTMREEVRKTYFEIDRQLKPKIKCLTNELKMHDIEEPALILHCMKVPQFLQRMEKRAREREEKHAMIRERRKQMEEERLRLKQQEELARSEMDKEEKIQRMKELKEKRKKEKIEGIRKKQLAERMRALTVMADLHYERNLMAKYGIRPFRLMVEIKRDNIMKAKAHYRFQIKKNVFLHWMWYTEDMWFERNYKAEDFYRKKMLGKFFAGLKQNHHDGYVLKRQVAEDYYDFYVTQLVFRKFREGIEILRKEQEIKYQKAVLYCNSNLLFKTFTCWRTLPALNALKRQQEVRKARWRKKVLQVVPDYTPPED